MKVPIEYNSDVHPHEPSPELSRLLVTFLLPAPLLTIFSLPLISFPFPYLFLALFP